MKPLYSFLDICRNNIRGIMRRIARTLHHISHGHITPNGVTLFALAAHVPAAWLIATGNFYWAAAAVTVFGLMDALDGELARLQGKASNMGMLLDATTDRLKETILYSGAAFYLAYSDQPGAALWAVAACGFSVAVSYVKAKGELAVTGNGMTPNEINRLFQDGLLRYEVRMALLIFGLLINQLAIMLIIITVLSAYTVVERLIKIGKKLG
jgi:phosphatidylglycerophosphate synthase